MPCPSQGGGVIGGLCELGVARLLGAVQKVLEGVRVIPVCRCTFGPVSGVAVAEGDKRLLACSGTLGVGDGKTMRSALFTACSRASLASATRRRCSFAAFSWISLIMRRFASWLRSGLRRMCPIFSSYCCRFVVLSVMLLLPIVVVPSPRVRQPSPSGGTGDGGGSQSTVSGSLPEPSR